MKPTCETIKFKKFVNDRSFYNRNFNESEDVYIPSLHFTYKKQSFFCAQQFDNFTNVFNRNACSNCHRLIPDQDLNRKLCSYCSTDDGFFNWGPSDNIHCGSVPVELSI